MRRDSFKFILSFVVLCVIVELTFGLASSLLSFSSVDSHADSVLVRTHVNRVGRGRKPKVVATKAPVRDVGSFVWHSQQNEDVLLLKEFFWKDDLALSEGIFVEVGALDGRTYSNTLTLETELGWGGVLIEGCPDNAAMLMVNRPSPRVRKFSLAVCDLAINKDGFVPLSTPCSAISGVDGHGDDFMLKAHQGPKQNVPCKPMSFILQNASVPYVDLMSIDVEGFELPLLKTVDFGAIPVRVVLIEVDHNSPNELSEIRQLMQKAGFTSHGLCCGSHADEIWVNQKFKRDNEKWVPMKWDAFEGAAKDVWRLKPCEPLPSSQMAVHRDRDSRGDSKDFASYVQSFNSEKFSCRPDPVMQQALTDLETGPNWSPVNCTAKDGTKFQAYPFSFGIIEQNFRLSSTQPHVAFSPAIPGFASSYAYTDEISYYLGYNDAFYAITMKKAGWDCMRHYEILAAGSVPYFLNLDWMPPNTMRTFPRGIVSSLMNLPGVKVSYTPAAPGEKFPDTVHSATIDFSTFPKERYFALRKILRQYAERYMTTTAIARNMLQAAGVDPAKAKRVLFITDRTDNCPGCKGTRVPVDYADTCVHHGLKMLFGPNCQVFPAEPDFPFLDYPKEKAFELYGHGFSYSRRLSPSLKSSPLTNEQVKMQLREGQFDAVIYGVPSGEPKPLLDDVIKAFIKNPKRVMHIDGDDSEAHFTLKFTCSRLQHVPSLGAKYGHTVFVREL